MLLFNNIFVNIPLAIICLVVGIRFFKKAKTIKHNTQCEECGSKIEENQKVCSNCGNPLKNAEQQRLICNIVVGACVLGFVYSAFNLLRFVGVMFNMFLA